MTQAYCAHAKKHEFDTIDIPDCNGGDHGYAFATNFNPEVNLREVSAPAAGWAPPAPSGMRGMSPELTGLLDRLHFHTLCEQDSDALEITLNAVAEGFGDVLPGMKWLNFGGVWGGKVFSGPMTSGFLSGAAAWGTGLAHRGTGQQKDSSRDDCCPFVMR